MPLSTEGFEALFRDFNARLERNEVAELLQAARHEMVAPGTAVLVEGASNDRLVFVYEGSFTVRVLVDGKPVEVGRAGPGDVLGEVSFVLGNAASATVTASAPSAVMVLSRDSYEELGRRSPSIPEGMTRVLCHSLADRLLETTRRFDALHATLGKYSDASPPPAAQGAGGKADPNDALQIPRGGILGAMQALLGIVRN